MKFTILTRNPQKRKSDFKCPFWSLVGSRADKCSPPTLKDFGMGGRVVLV
jgi:hypothetical protein